MDSFGHSAFNFSDFTAVAALYFSGDKIIWKSALILGILIAFPRMYLYVHYPMDILGGIIAGIFAGFVGAQIVLHIKRAGK